MSNITFVTGNSDKFHTAQTVFAKHGLMLQQSEYEIDEIQSQDSETIALDKAAKAFAITKAPTIISDDCWSFTGLNGFPGPYMKDINQWFTVEDLWRLVGSLDNREVFLIQNVVYQDNSYQQLFKKEISGVVLPGPKGSIGKPNEKIVSLTPDGKSISEVYETDRSALADLDTAWEDVVGWLKDKI